MSPPEGCPFCRCKDVRPLSDPALELVGYRCHDCERTFYVTTVKESPQPAKVTAIRARRKTRETPKAS